MSPFKKILIKISGNRVVQGVLEKRVKRLQFLMGIGAGSGVSSSGEVSVMHTLKGRSTPPYCIFDVGSNKGQFLRLVLNSTTADTVSIHCFEPGRETFKALSDSFSADERIRLNNLGLGKDKGEATLYFDEAGSGLASLSQRRLGHYGIDFNKSEVVGIDTIDNYCSENGIDHIHWLKIDIEGHELDALAGAGSMFDERAIDIVTFEFGGCNIDTRTFFQDFWYFFRGVDMDLFRIAPSGYLHPIRTYQEIHEQFRTKNFAALSRR